MAIHISPHRLTEPPNMVSKTSGWVHHHPFCYDVMYIERRVIKEGPMVDWNVKGCLIPLVTPFDDRGQLDEAALRRLVNYLIEEQAADALVPRGTTGGSPT